MPLVLKVSAGGVPAGSYLAKFLGYESTTTEFGDCLRWQFEVVNGQHTGSRTSRITGLSPTTKNACGRVLSGITGKPLTAGEDIDLESFIGRTYWIVVVNTDSGGTKVESVSPPPVG